MARTGRDRASIRALGARASAFTQGRLLGRWVGIEGDVESHDRYRRRLAYLWLADGTLFNADLVRAGYATAYTIPPNVKYAEHFRSAERQARGESRGLWGKQVASRGDPHR